MGLNGDLGLRLPDVEWSVRANAGTLEGVEWVDARLNPDLPPMRVVGHDGEAKFRAYSYLNVLPTYIAEDTLAVEGRGRPTAWHGLAMLFSQPAWTVVARSHLWAPYSPFPGVLAKMVEAFGVERAVHRYDRERLSRLAAMLPSWYPSRGRLSAAHEVLAACGVDGEADTTWGQDVAAPAESIRDEVLCCHSAEWWRARQSEGAQPAYRISKGFLRFQPEGEGFPLRREDCLVAIGENGKISLALHRLLPAWTAIRVTTNEGTEPASVPPPAAEAKPPAPAEPKATPQGDQAGEPEKAPRRKGKGAQAAIPAEEAASEKPAKSKLVAPTVVPEEELEDDATQDALVPMDEESSAEEIDLLEVEEEPEEDPPTDPGSTQTERPASRREKGQKSTKKTDEK